MYFGVWCAGLSRSVVSDSLQPHKLHPTRLLGPWNSPGKNTGESCRFLLGTFQTRGLNLGPLHCRQSPASQADSLQLRHLIGDVLCLDPQSCLTLFNPMDYTPSGFSVNWDSPGKNPGMGCHALLQGLPNPGKKPRYPTVQVDSLLTEPPGNQLHSSACGDPVFQHYLLKSLSYFHWMMLAPMLKIIWLHNVGVYFRVLYYLPVTQMSILTPAQYHFNYYFVISFEITNCKITLALLFQDCFHYLMSILIKDRFFYLKK